MMNHLKKNNLDAINAFFEYKNVHFVTYGDGDSENKIFETCLTHVEDVGSKQTLDYIFEIFKDTEDRKRKFIEIDIDSLKVEKFIIVPYNKSHSNEKGQSVGKKYTQLSDHYGLSCELVYHEKESKENCDTVLDVKENKIENIDETNKLLDK